MARGLLRALSARAHARRARARPRAHHRALPERRRGDPRRHGRARHATTASSGPTCARRRSSASISRRTSGAPLVNLVRAAASSCAISRRATTRDGDASSTRSATPAVTLAIQIVPFGVDEKLLISRDVTQLEAVARMRRDFIANVSHELKTPLTVISGFVETLQELDLDERQRKRFLELMQRAGAQHAAAGRRPAHAVGAGERAEPARRRAVRHRAAAAGARGGCARRCRTASTRSRSTSATPAIDPGSRDELASAFGNLVTNAIRYTPAGGTITLALARRSPMATGVFSVTDTGHRHRARARAATDRALLSRRSPPLARDAAARASASPSSSTCCCATRRSSKSTSEPGQGQHVLGAAAGTAGDGSRSRRRDDGRPARGRRTPGRACQSGHAGAVARTFACLAAGSARSHGAGTAGSRASATSQRRSAPCLAAEVLHGRAPAPSP